MAIQINQDELKSVIYQAIIEDLPDGLEKAQPFYGKKLKSKKYKTGLYIQQPIKLIKNTAQGFIPMTGATVSGNPSPQIQHFILPWKAFNYNANFNLGDMNEVGGKTEIIDYVLAKTKGAQSDANRELGQAAVTGDTTVNPL